MILFVEEFVFKGDTEFSIVCVSGAVLSETTKLSFRNILDPFRVVTALKM